MMTRDELQALACEDCPAAATAQRGPNAEGRMTLTVVVEHEDSCPWAAANVPEGGALLVKQDGILWHRRAGDPPLGSDL